MSRTLVVNLRIEPCDVLITRPGDWGNPFVMGVDGTREEVVAKHLAWIKKHPQLLKRLGELKGKRLGCWCRPLLCHGDNYVELIEGKGSV